MFQKAGLKLKMTLKNKLSRRKGPKEKGKIKQE